jgi:5'-nucleotidase
MNTLTIVCDLDGIVIDLLGAWLEEYNKKWNDSLTIADLKSYHIERHVKPECGNKIYEVFDNALFYRNLKPLAGAVEGLKKLHSRGHDIVICTATAGDTAQEKFYWCAKYLPFIPSKNIFVGARKELLLTDIFIDDAPKNLLAHHKKWGASARTISIAYPYNEHLRDTVWLHAEDHTDTRKAWSEIVDAIQDVEEGLED